VTILFTDVVASTSLVARLGDERARSVLERHRDRATELVARHDGRTVKWLGDGVMAAFPSAAGAVGCVLEIQRQAAEAGDEVPIGLRAGLHAGEAFEEDGDFFGLAVITAKRLCDAASAGETLCSDLVAGLLAGRRSVCFADAGLLQLKGVPGPVQAFRVGARDDPASGSPAPAASAPIPDPPAPDDRAEAPLVEQARAALARGAWEDARHGFEAALAEGESAAALEGLGTAASWLEDADATFAARERAYRLYQAAGDRIGAARVAIALAFDHFSFRGEDAVAGGWLARAHRLLEGLGPVPEAGWLALQEGELAVLSDNDPLAARARAADAIAVGRAVGSVEIEMAGVALDGLALVSAGKVTEGMRRIDASTAAVVAGEFADAAAICGTSCYLIYACEKARDYARAAQWCERLHDFSRRWRITPAFAVCRTHYAGVLMFRGAWTDAEAQLTGAIADLEASRPAMAVEGIARLGELRRRQGRLQEAGELLAQAELIPRAQVSLAALALDRGDAVGAADRAERLLRALPLAERSERPGALELLVHARARHGDFDGAASALAELDSIADEAGALPLRAAASFAAGALASATGDHADARRRFEDALDGYRRSGSPFEAARARAELGRTLAALGRADAARQELEAAEAALRTIGARLDAERAGTADARVASELPAGLTDREAEVLRLVAAGRSNREIADELVLSVKTVARHLSNIFFKLGVSSRTAAAAFAYRHGIVRDP